MPNKSPKYISSAVYRQSGFSGLHPLAISRIGAVETIVRALGWLEDPDYIESTPASIETLRLYHDPAYIQALKQADEEGHVSTAMREKYNFGTMENPLFKGLFDRAATTIDGSIKAARHVLAGGLAFHPAGGTHHGRPDKAYGFCYFNDPVFAILTLLNGGMARVAYIDIDAHHGDGVEIAFADDPRIMTLSIHEQDRWPFSGTVPSQPERFIYNAPVPKHLNDAEFSHLIQTAALPLLDRFKPDAIVIVCGADGLSGDPLSSMALNNIALWQAVIDLVNHTPAAIVLGGGGYNPWTTVRCWAGLWGHLAGFNMPKALPDSVTALLKSFDSDLVDEEDIDPLWLTTLEDRSPSAISTGNIRPEIRELVKKITA